MDIENYTKNYKIFVDMSSLMDDNFWILIKNLKPLLSKYKNKIIIAYVIEKQLLDLYNSNNKNLNKKKVKKVLDGVDKLIKENVCVIVGNLSDVKSPNIFKEVFPTLNKKYNILFITENPKRKKEVLSIKKSKSLVVKNLKKLIKESFSFQENLPQSNKFKLPTQIVQTPDKPLNVTYIPKENDTVYYSNSKSAKIIQEIGKGGEGSVYELSDGKICKIYAPNKLSQHKYEKLKLMITNKIIYPGICWPTDLLYNRRKEFVGYTMPKAEGKELEKVMLNRKTFEKHFPNWNKTHLIKLSITILNMIKHLHDRNIILGDINPANILVKNENEVYFVDTDSYQIEGYPCPVGTPSFTAPEIQGKRYNEFLRTFGNEYFAIAVLLFRMFMGNKSPYSKRDGAGTVKNIKDMDFSYPFRTSSDGNREYNLRAPLGIWRYLWSHLSYSMKEDFYNSFHKNGKYNKENTRLSTDKWIEELKKYLNDIRIMQINDPESLKIYPTRFKKSSEDVELGRCIICGKEELKDALRNGICRDCLNKPYTVRKCVSCGKEFVITQKEYIFYKNKGYDLPKRCKDCLKNKKNQSNEYHNNYYNNYNQHTNSYNNQYQPQEGILTKIFKFFFG